MRTSKEVQLLRELLADINGAEQPQPQPVTEPKFIPIITTGKNGGPGWMILTRGDGVIYLEPDKGNKTKVKSNAGAITVAGTPDEIKDAIGV